MKKWAFAVAVVTISAFSLVNLRATNTFTLISGGTGPYGVSFAAMSADGSRIYFVTQEPLVAADQDANYDVYRGANGAITLISGGIANADAAFLGESADGSRVIFQTAEPLVAGDTDVSEDIYQYMNGALTLLSGGSQNVAASFRAVHGATVFFETAESLVAGDLDTLTDVYAATGGALTLVSANTPQLDAFFRAANADGTKVIVMTDEPLAGNDTDGAADLYMFSNGSATRLTGGTAPLFAAFAGATADLSHVFFRTLEQLSASDTDDKFDVYEAFNGSINLLSGTTDVAGIQFVGASADGTRVFLESFLPLAGDADDGATDVYQSLGGSLTLLTGNGIGQARFAGASGDGTRVFFSTPDQLAAGDVDSSYDIYQAMGGSFVLLSGSGPAACAVPAHLGNCDAFFASASADGNKVLFISAESLTANDGDGGLNDAYVSSGGALTLRSPDGAAGGAELGAIGSFDMSVVLLVTTVGIDPNDQDTQAADLYTSVESVQPPIDVTSPTVTCAAADGLWHADNVSLPCTSQDGGSGLANPADATFSLTTAVPAGQQTTNAFTNSRQVCDVAGNCTTAQIGGNQIDRRAPVINVVAPITGAVFTIGQVVPANYSCEDNGSGVASCSGSVASNQAIDTASLGTKTFAVAALDNVGNSANVSVPYSVVAASGGYAFGGFLAPVDPLPTLNSMKAGAAVPVNFSLGGFHGLDIFAAGYPKSQPVACSSTSPEDGIEQTINAGGSSLSYDVATDQYSYVWKTNKLWAGTCRQLILQFTDGSIGRANFKFK